ncbi:uncharacterized protein B0I36DRAFT_367064 [Microdochium trichocladiopsis]|uniref:Glycosyltransferase family 25 protein n=1 Tax=Microdochium trichocladiopsis TaxID=1682393 RepID=A0A9P8XXQ0_9PEZI|nr:uncharacterized protein B0I36DRAFT_367064 [Microdochium trichocladiopsis]KAH7025184.1 hypothetical protein B0I36DRAFT_367064 [Microdochium trichocladiopsis]
MLVLSKTPSWRTRGLNAATQLTGLDFTIAPQPPVAKLSIETFRKMGSVGKTTRPEPGSAAAWLAHLETALILEDDVNWDLRIKDQMRLVSDNVRAFGRSYGKTGHQLVSDLDDSTPYGTGLDVLWVGHCGSLSHNQNGHDENHRRPVYYIDPTRPTNQQYYGWARDFVINEVPQGRRAVHESRMTKCTFAYAVSQKGAYNLFNPATAPNGEAFDCRYTNTAAIRS